MTAPACRPVNELFSRAKYLPHQIRHNVRHVHVHSCLGAGCWGGSWQLRYGVITEAGMRGEDAEAVKPLSAPCDAISVSKLTFPHSLRVWLTVYTNVSRKATCLFKVDSSSACSVQFACSRIRRRPRDLSKSVRRLVASGWAGAPEHRPHRREPRKRARWALASSVTKEPARRVKVRPRAPSAKPPMEATDAL